MSTMLCKLWTASMILILKSTLATHIHFQNFNKFHYHLSKLPDLIPSYELEQNPNWTFDFIDDTDESARGYGDPVYARRRLKNVADALSSTFTFDFSQNNWHLWLQFEVAMWLSENDVS